MMSMQIRSYQVEAINAIHEALNREQKRIVIEMISGTGVNIVLAKTIELIHKQKNTSVLVIMKNILVKEQLECDIFNKYQEFILVDKERVQFTTEQYIISHKLEIEKQYEYVIFDEIDTLEALDKVFNYSKKTLIIFSRGYERKSSVFFTTDDVVFSYDFNNAVKSGLITPAMDVRAIEPAMAEYTKQLLEKFGCMQIENSSHGDKYQWDGYFKKNNQTIWVEWKIYKNHIVSPSASNSLLNSMVVRKMNQGIPKEDIILLIVLSKIPSFQKDEIYRRYQIIVWDIDNLVYYSKDNLFLLKQLSRITYYPIDYIKGESSEEAELAGLKLISTDDKRDEKEREVKKESDEIKELIQCLSGCKTGKSYSREYEELCEKIMRTLFEANYFNKLRNQYKTKDDHFRMDLIGSLKIDHNNGENMHPLWKMFVQHYNSHFVVFEFKNYSKQIDQNLIYITEKYLFNASLRNVAIIISRKGFSKSAKFAAQGCLREHGKLILDITDADLIEMLKLQNEEAADYILDKLEDFLMGISK